MSEKTSFDRIAESLAGSVSEERLEDLAEKALEEAIKSYDVQQSIRKVVTGPVEEMVKTILGRPEFKEKLINAVEDKLVGIVQCSAEQTCAKLVAVLNEKPDVKYP